MRRLFIWSMRRSCVECVGITSACDPFLVDSWYQALDAFAFRSYKEFRILIGLHMESVFIATITSSLSSFSMMSVLSI